MYLYCYLINHDNSILLHGRTNVSFNLMYWDFLSIFHIISKKSEKKPLLFKFYKWFIIYKILILIFTDVKINSNITIFQTPVVEVTYDWNLIKFLDLKIKILLFYDLLNTSKPINAYIYIAQKWKKRFGKIV